MKILVTVGTTAFDALIKQVDDFSLAWTGGKIFSQIGPGSYLPVNHEYCRYRDSILYSVDFDFVICHCGAGTLYSILERSVPFIAVPNLSRRDKHQLEIAEFIASEGYGLINFNVDSLSSLLVSQPWDRYVARPYKKEPFFLGNELRSIVGLEHG